VFPREHAVLTQNRLAVIDLVTGDPPITNEDGSVGVVLNGEIYNYKALRAALVSRGHELRTEGDTEVIAHLAEELEPAELARQLDGMFAFAVWNDRERQLVLGRDCFGKKPLYYWVGDGKLVFASELKAVLAHPSVPRRLDPRAIPAYLTFGYVPTPYTFFEGIQSVPPGHVLTMGPSGTVRLEEYWRPPIPGVDASPLDLSLDEAGREVRERLTTAIERRLVADVPLGAFLSGGIDSSLVVALMAQLLDRPVKTFTIGFEDSAGFDERPYARAVAEQFQTEHTEFVVQPDMVDLIERLVWHYDQPFGDSSSLPTFLLSELTRDHVTVALSGDGGDELFAGYERFGAALALNGYRRLPASVRDVALRALGALPADGLRGRVGSAQRFASRADLGLPDAFISWLSYVSEPTRAALLEEPSDWAIDAYRSVWSDSQGADVLDRLLNVNLRTYLLDDLLPKTDRMSMAHALEVRSPFLDRDLAEFALRLPRSTKIKNVSLKRVLKAAAKDVLPAEILGRRKRGFGVPLDRWFRSDLKAYTDGMLGSSNARVRSYLVPGALDKLLAEHRSGAKSNGHAIWALLTLEVFLRREGW